METLWAGVRSEGGNVLTERPAQGTGETPHGSFCLPESHCEESQEQGFKVPSVVVDFSELVKEVHEHVHVDCSPTQIARSVVLGAAQGSILTVGSSLGRGRESQASRLPKSSLETHGLLVTGFPATGHIFWRQADVAHPRPGSFGSHGHRIDFCESAVLNHFAI
jgi:hypothetical protein